KCRIFCYYVNMKIISHALSEQKIMTIFQRSHLLLILLAWAVPASGALARKDEPQKSFELVDEPFVVRITTEYYNINILKEGFRYAFYRPDGVEIAAAHLISGLQIGKSGQIPEGVVETRLVTEEEEGVVLEVITKRGVRATVNLRIRPHAVKMQVHPQEEGVYSIIAGTKGLGPVYGLADHAAFKSGGKRRKSVGTELSGFRADTLLGHRMVSNFAIFP